MIGWTGVYFANNNTVAYYATDSAYYVPDAYFFKLGMEVRVNRIVECAKCDISITSREIDRWPAANRFPAQDAGPADPRERPVRSGRHGHVPHAADVHQWAGAAEGC